MNVSQLHAAGQDQQFVGRVAGAIQRHCCRTLADPCASESAKRCAVQHIGFSAGVGEMTEVLSSGGMGPWSTDGQILSGVASIFNWTGGVNASDQGIWESS